MPPPVRRLPMHIEITPRRQHRISLTPLIDVVFILLVFFMLASSLMDWRGIDIATGSAPADADHPPSATVIVRADDAIGFDGGRFDSPADVAGILRRQLASGDISSVVVQPAEGVTLGRTIAVFDALAGSGIDALALGRD